MYPNPPQRMKFTQKARKDINHIGIVDLVNSTNVNVNVSQLHRHLRFFTERMAGTPATAGTSQQQKRQQQHECQNIHGRQPQHHYTSIPATSITHTTSLKILSVGKYAKFVKNCKKEKKILFLLQSINMATPHIILSFIQSSPG
jgi:hypothetical protein